MKCSGHAISLAGGVAMVPGRENIGALLALRANTGDWDQKWEERFNDAILSRADASDDQTWSPRFVEPNYDYALLAGFPGDVEDGCLSSTQDRTLAQAAMHSCDQTMDFLIGSSTSVGTLRDIATLVEDEGPERMPGMCKNPVVILLMFYFSLITILTTPQQISTPRLHG